MQNHINREHERAGGRPNLERRPGAQLAGRSQLPRCRPRPVLSRAWQRPTREAKEVCRGCVVRLDCLEYALVNGEKFGIWGGSRSANVVACAVNGPRQPGAPAPDQSSSGATRSPNAVIS